MVRNSTLDWQYLGGYRFSFAGRALRQILPSNPDELTNEILIPHVKAFLDSIFPQSRSTKKPATNERFLVALDSTFIPSYFAMRPKATHV